MWPAAQLLADYLAANTHIMAGCPCALELGSGLGFPGIIAAQACPTAALLALLTSSCGSHPPGLAMRFLHIPCQLGIWELSECLSWPTLKLLKPPALGRLTSCFATAASVSSM